MKMKHRIISLVLSVVLCISMIPSIAFAESTTPYYLALGDSITTGYGLDDADECFTVILANQIGAELENKAADGYTSEDVLADLESGELDSSIASANLITITLGGNDMMDVFYQSVADVYNEENNADMTVEDIKAVLAAPTSNLTVALRLLNIVNSEEFVAYLETSQDLVDAVDLFTENLKNIISYLRAENASNVILVETQYNPYLWIGDDYANITAAFQVGVDALNNAINGAASSGYTVADVATAFANSTENLCNADSSLSNLSFDFHPNAAGHQVIADVMAETYENATTQDDPQDDPQVDPELEVVSTSFDWADDYSSCTMTVTLSDNSQETITCNITSTTIDATCTETEQTVYTATASYDSEVYTDKQTVVTSAAKGHTYVNGSCTVCGATDPSYTSSGSQDNDNQGNNDDNSSNTSQNSNAGTETKSITLNKSTATIYTGSKLTLKATVTGLSGNVTFSSSNTKVATITQKGVVKAKKAGTTKITAKIGNYTATCKVTVKKTTLKLKKSSKTIKAGRKYTIKATTNSSGMITFSSSNKRVASVSKKGVIKAKKAGKATITVKCNGVTKKFKVKVVKK